jgi:hypothetical protein
MARGWWLHSKLCPRSMGGSYRTARTTARAALATLVKVSVRISNASIAHFCRLLCSWNHAQDVPPYTWTTQTIDGTAMGVAFASWYTSTMSTLRNGTGQADSILAGHRFVEKCSIEPCGSDTC